MSDSDVAGSRGCESSDRRKTKIHGAEIDALYREFGSNLTLKWHGHLAHEASAAKA
jgi:hypothetical protein